MMSRLLGFLATVIQDLQTDVLHGTEPAQAQQFITLITPVHARFSTLLEFTATKQDTAAWRSWRTRLATELRALQMGKRSTRDLGEPLSLPSALGISFTLHPR